ncbi:hypothetical protein RhiirA5_504384 [Rhizophagus irregularis]|uniref:Uncharacterized protein n=1 Tax=Rhizophagus irregularis TaxID=588596 RepID=A0A2N0P4U6_9GLOM|nr:hypothetical protein RhiirA5_504384 [Rhizophagus irregularis]
MSDNTKLRPHLQYSSQMGCIIGSTFLNNETNINTYDDISITINKIKENNAVAKYVRAYILQINADFDFTELLEMVPKIGHYIKALNSKKISFNKDKSVLIQFILRYQFKYNQNFIKNDQIHHIFDQSRQIACNLAKYLGMLTSNIVLINSFWPYVLINSNDMEISDSNDENMQDSENSNENPSNSSLSQAISHVAKKVDLLKQRENKRNEMDIDEESRNLSLNEYFDDMIFVTKNGIDFQEMIYRYEKHHNIERTIKTNNTRIINSTSINPNQANHIEPITDIENISYLTLKVFTSIHNIFSAEIERGYVLITYQCPKNVLYHLDI